jgi:plasmid stabilization system protein ParE
VSRQVRFTRRAERDIRRIQTWLAARSRVGALRWLDALHAALDRLRDDAQSGPRAPEAEEVGVELRQRVFQTRRGHPYRLVYLLKEQTIHVLAVRGAGQGWVTAAELELSD